jgi:fructoselysine-6-P-deglycase FrlB-like protein
MMHARHRIEGVGKQGRPGLDRRLSLFKRRRCVTDRDDDTCPPQDPGRLGEVSPFRRHRHLAQGAVGRVQKPLNQVGIGVAKKGRIVGTAVLAGQEWALEVDPKDRRVSPGLGRRDANLGDQNVGGGRDQREQLTSSAVLAVESPGRTDGVAPLAVRCPGTTVVVDVEQSRAEDMPRAVDNIRVVFDEIAPAAARARCEDAIVFEGDEGIGLVNTRADQPDGVDDGGGGAAHGPQLRCIVWPMALDNTLIVVSRAELGAEPARPSRYVSTEIADQPSAWARAAELGPTEPVRHALPERGQRVAIIGCGTSFFMAQSFAVLRERSGHGETDAFPASEFPAGRSYDTLVALTRSGTTTEVLRLLGTLRNSAGPRTVAITADPDAPVVDLADDRVVLNFADEKSIVQTRFATTSLALWRAWLGDDLTAVVEQGRSALTDPLPPRTLDSSQFTFLGSGMSVGIANEAALKLREASRSWTESYPAMEFRHGPISVVERASTVWVFGSPPSGLLEDLQVTGAHVECSGLDPMADLIRVQRLAVALAEAKGLNPDEPQHLARSVLLP